MFVKLYISIFKQRHLVALFFVIEQLKQDIFNEALEPLIGLGIKP